MPAAPVQAGCLAGCLRSQAGQSRSLTVQGSSTGRLGRSVVDFLAVRFTKAESLLPCLNRRAGCRRNPLR